MSLHSDTAIYKTTYDLCVLITKLVANMSKEHRGEFGRDLRKDCFFLVRLIYRANNARDKQPILATLREEIESVNLSIRLAVDLKLISYGQYSRAIVLIESAGKQATGWYQSSEKALVASPSRR